LGGCELVRPPWKSVWRFLKKLKVWSWYTPGHIAEGTKVKTPAHLRL
jgi:hypothetical protein